MTRTLALPLGILLSLFVPRPDVWAAQPVYLDLATGDAQIDGESTVVSMDRENSIECLSYRHSMGYDGDATAGSGGPRFPMPLGTIKITKRIDQATPLLAKAFVQAEDLEGTFRFFRPNPSGDGTTEQYYTVTIGRARIAAITTVSPDVIDPATANAPPTEEVTFVFSAIKWEYTKPRVTFEATGEPTSALQPTTLIRDDTEGATQPGRLRRVVPGARQRPTLRRPAE